MFVVEVTAALVTARSRSPTSSASARAPRGEVGRAHGLRAPDRGLALVHRLLRHLRRGPGRGARQGPGGDPAQDPLGDDGPPPLRRRDARGRRLVGAARRRRRRRPRGRDDPRRRRRHRGRRPTSTRRSITGESAPVLKEPGTDIRSSVTGGTTLTSDTLTIRITANPGETFLDRMIALVEGAKRQRTPNEIALVDPALRPDDRLPAGDGRPCGRSALYAGAPLGIVVLVALLVCLIPTTIGGLLSAIGIAGMDRVARFNVLAMSGRAVEAAGDVDVILLDKTGTITFGNRLASRIVALPGRRRSARRSRRRCSRRSRTRRPRAGRSSSWPAKRLAELGAAGRDAATSRLRRARGDDRRGRSRSAPRSRTSGVILADGTVVLKGAVDAIVAALDGEAPPELADARRRDRRRSAPRPWRSAATAAPLGVIELKDTVKPGLDERFDELRRMGIRTVMVTGDNPLTAKTIAARGRRGRLHRPGQARGQDRPHPRRAGRRPPRRDDRRRHERRARPWPRPTWGWP